jgi:peptidylprolyl isomerase
MKRLLALALIAAPVAAQDQPAPVTPASIVAAAPKNDWKPIDPADLLVMTLAPDAAGNPRTVVIQLIPPPFSQGWVGNIRTLAKAHWWDGTSVYRVVDNWVTQWGDGEDDQAKAKPLPPGLRKVPESEYTSVPVGPIRADIDDLRAFDTTDGHELSGQGSCVWNNEKGNYECYPVRSPEFPAQSYATFERFERGWPYASDFERVWPVHCYGYVGVARDLETTGTGAELYTVIGTPPRQLDRNIAVVGRVIEGIENLSALPRGKGEAGVYDDPKLRVPILSVRIGDELTGPPPVRIPRYQQPELWAIFGSLGLPQRPVL